MCKRSCASDVGAQLVDGGVACGFEHLPCGAVWNIGCNCTTDMKRTPKVQKARLDKKQLQKLSKSAMAKVVGGWGNGCWNQKH